MSGWGAGCPGVLQILPRLDADGATRGAIDMARTVIAAGGTSVIASSGGAMVGEYRQAGGIHLEIPMQSRLPWQPARVATTLVAATQEHGIEVVHAYGRRGAQLARRVTKKTGKPFIASPIGSEEFPPEEWVTAEMADAAAIVAASPFVASLVPTDMAVSVEIIPRGVDTVRFNPAAVSADRLIRQAADWRADDLSSIMLVPARLTPSKGHDVLLRAMARMKNRDAMCLFLARESDNVAFRDELSALVTDLGLDGRVRFVGQTPDMPVAYMMADVVVLPSRRPEAFNSAAAEAQAMGRPVVASDLGSTDEIVMEGTTGWLPSPDDPDALADALDKALAIDDHTRAILATRSRLHIERHFSLAQMCDTLLEVYRNCAVGSAAAA